MKTKLTALAFTVLLMIGVAQAQNISGSSQSVGSSTFYNLRSDGSYISGSSQNLVVALGNLDES